MGKVHPLRRSFKKKKIKSMSFLSYERYEKERMEKNAWHVSKQVAERIDDAPVLKEYINSKLSETPEELFFFNSCELECYGNASENSKSKVPGAAYFRKIENLIDEHYIRGELFIEYCRDSCKERAEN